MVTLDDNLLEMLASDALDPLTISEHHLRTGVRRLTRGQLATPILCGSSLRNVGVQPLMDGIVEYIPGPSYGGGVIV